MRLQLEIILELSKYKPLPTCNKDNGKFLQKYKVLPLTRLARVQFGSGSGVLGPNLNLHSRFGSKQVPNTNINQMFMFKMFGSGSNNVQCQKNHFANFKYMLSSFTIATDSLSHLTQQINT